MGGKTHVISLPSQWIKKYNVKKGEELHVEEIANSVLVSTDKISKGEICEINLKSLDVMLRRVLAATYKSGCEEVKVLYENRDQLALIEDVLHKACIGFEINHQGENFVVIKSLTHIDPKEYSNSLRRLFFSLEIMQQDLHYALTKNCRTLLSKVVEKDEQINRLADFCRRVINSGNLKNVGKSTLHYYIVEQLERIGDIHKKIAQLLLDNKIKPNEQTIAIFLELHEFFKAYHKLFYDFNLEATEQFGKEFYALREKMRTHYVEENKEYYPLLMYEEFLLETIFDMNGALLTLNV